MVNPKTAICKTRRVRGLEISLIERAINLYNMTYLKLPLLEISYQIFFFNFIAPFKLIQKIK